MNAYQSSKSSLLSLDSKRYKLKPILIPYIEGKPLNGIFNYANEKNNLLLSASSNNEHGNPRCGDVYLLIHMKDGTTYYTRNVDNSYIEASLKDKSFFIVKKYLIRGNYNLKQFQLQSWVLEGKKYDSDNWEIIDSVDNSPIKQYEMKVFFC